MNAKQALFVQEYLVDFNATQAAIRAGYSAKTARAVGHENLTKPDISYAIREATKVRGDRLGINQDYVVLLTTPQKFQPPKVRAYDNL